jgi:two-component sensor histidine kinase
MASRQGDSSDAGAEQIEQIMATPNLADALESDRFKQFLDHVPVAIAVSELHPSERITYANLEFERLVGHTAAEMEGQNWKTLAGLMLAQGQDGPLGEAVATDQEYIGTFTIIRDDQTTQVDAWSNTIVDDDGVELFRLVALAKVGQHLDDHCGEAIQALRDKDIQLLELQHRVKNNLQMITALIRLEARNVADDESGERFDRLTGRVNSLALLYDALAANGLEQTVDLGVYLSQVASSVMQAHAVEGIRLDLKVDTWPVSINVAMPAGLVVNELLTNALKHAFTDSGGTITLHSLIDENGCRVTIADDGVGLPEGVTWPKPGKLGAAIAESLRRNARADFVVTSAPGQGVQVAIFFPRAAAASTA